MEAVLGVSLPVFIGMTLVLMGGAAFLMGQALAATWRPIWQVIFYSFLLAIGTRFLSLSLFYGDPFFQIGNWLYGIVVDTVCHIAYSLFAYRLTRVGKLVDQYPWLYERAGPLGYRAKATEI